MLYWQPRTKAPCYVQGVALWNKPARNDRSTWITPLQPCLTRILCSTFHRTDEDIFSMKGIVMRTGSHFVQTTASSFERFRGTKQCGELALDSDSAWCFSRDKNLEHVIKVDLGKPMRFDQILLVPRGMPLQPMLQGSGYCDSRHGALR